MMKKQLRMIAALLSLSLVLLLSACGGTNTSGTSGTDTSTSEAAPVAVSEEEYQQAVVDLQAELTEVQSNKIEVNDLEAAKQQLEALKQPFADFMNIVPPEAYADAHAKLQSGCQSMIDYVDIAIQIVEATNDAKRQELSTQLVAALQTGAADLAEGATMLEEAMG